VRVHRLKDRSPSAPPFRIDLVLRGSHLGSGGQGDRFRCPSETRSAKLHAQRCQMIVDLWQRGRRDLLEARLADRFSTDELHVAYKSGEAALEALLRSKSADGGASSGPDSGEAVRLVAAIDEYLAFNLALRSNEKPRVRTMLMRFDEWLRQRSSDDTTIYVPSVRDVTAPHVLAFLAQLTSQHHYKGRPVSAATRNRYRTALGGLASRLVKRKLIDEHFIRDGGLAKFDEGGPRLPSWTPAERTAYLAAIATHRPEFLPVFYLLANTGADMCEVLSRRVRDVHFGERLTRVDYRRTKTDTLPRLVPLHAEYADALREHIREHRLKLGDVLFGMFRRHQIENAHERARTAIGRGTWREMVRAALSADEPPPAAHDCDPIRIKDLRHFSAIAWAMAGLPIERIADYLGHSTIRLTMIYARFRPHDDYDAPMIERAHAIATGAT
jgi:integrase